MVSPSGLKTPSVTKKAASTPSDDNSSKEPLVSIAAMTSLDSNAGIDDAGPPTPPVRALREHILSSENDNHKDSYSAHSNLSAIHTLDNSKTSDSNFSSVKTTNSKEVPLRPNTKAPRKTLGKRSRTDSNAGLASSNGAAVVPAKKRVRSNALTRSAPLATSTTTPGGLAGNSEFINFTATIFIIQLGPDGPQFHAHESVLKRSPKLAEEIDKAKTNKRAAKQNTLPLMTHDAIAFEQMLQFLYKDKFLLSKNKSSPDERLGELKELMSLAKHYVLPGLQKQVVKFFSSSKILSKIPPRRFFDWAEDMYYEELDHENGPFKVYLSKVAPTLMKGADEATRKEMVGMVKQGGGFAEQLFIAAATALDVQTSLTVVKKEEDRIPARPHITKGKGKEPVRQTADEQASDMPEDVPTEDDEGLFVRD